MSAIAGGDELAFQQLYRRYSSVVYSLARRVTGRDQDAEDVVADVFWELWSKSDRYDPSKSSLFTYLVMLTRCRALDKKRGESRHSPHAILEWAAHSTRPSDAHQSIPVESLSIAEQRANVRRAME